MFSDIKRVLRREKASEQCEISKLAPYSHCALHMMFIYKMIEVKCCMRLRK